MDEDEILICNRLPKMPIKSQRLRNPFLLKIDSESLKFDNYLNGLQLNIICECSFWLFSFWAVKIKEFHEKLSLDFKTIKNLLLDNKFINSDICHFNNDPELYKDEYNKIVHKIQPPEKFDSNFFKIQPRDRYPLAIILLLNDREIEDEIQQNDIVLLATIIHLKDKLIPLDTSIIAQYIKRKSGVILNLQDLYICTDDQQQSEQQNKNHMPYCIICLDNPIQRALLPCRHACVCSICLEKINTCPLCRSTIQNFLNINQPISSSAESVSTSSPNNETYNENNYDPTTTQYYGRHSSRTSTSSNNGSFLGRIQKFLGF